MTGKFALLLEYALLQDALPQVTAAEAAQYFVLMNLDLFREAAQPGKRFEPSSGKEIQDGFARAAVLAATKASQLDLDDELSYWQGQFESSDSRALELLEKEGFSLQAA